jgi:HEAT repeat protein
VEELSEPGGRAKHTSQKTFNPNHDTLKLHLKNIVSSDYLARIEAASQLRQFGRDGAEAIVQMLLKANDLSAFPALTHALEEIGRPAVESIVAALEHLEIRRERDVYLAECLVGVLRHIAERRSSPVIVRVVDKFNTVIERNGNSVLVAVCQHAKLKAHTVLGELGDRSRVTDLMAQVEKDHRLINPEIIEVLSKVGDKRALVPLFRLLASNESPAIQDDALEAIREIVKREKIAANDGVFARLGKAERGLMFRVFSSVKPVNGHNGFNGSPHGNGAGHSSAH